MVNMYKVMIPMVREIAGEEPRHRRKSHSSEGSSGRSSPSGSIRKHYHADDLIESDDERHIHAMTAEEAMAALSTGLGFGGQSDDSVEHAETETLPKEDIPVAVKSSVGNDKKWRIFGKKR